MTIVFLSISLGHYVLHGFTQILVPFVRMMVPHDMNSPSSLSYSWKPTVGATLNQTREIELGSVLMSRALRYGYDRVSEEVMGKRR
jgi:hypothetical protein